MSTKSVIKLKKNKALDLMWHEESTVVFKDKMAVGRFEDGALVPFDDLVLEMCEKYKFRYDPELLNGAEEEGEEEEEEEPEEEAPQEEEEKSQTTAETAPPPDVPTSRPTDSTGLRGITTAMEASLFSYFNTIVESHTEEVTNLKLSICSLESQVDALKEEVRAKDGQIESLVHSKQNLEDDVVDLRVERDTATESLSRIQSILSGRITS